MWVLLGLLCVGAPCGCSGATPSGCPLSLVMALVSGLAPVVTLSLLWPSRHNVDMGVSSCTLPLGRGWLWEPLLHFGNLLNCLEDHSSQPS